MFKCYSDHNENIKRVGSCYYCASTCSHLDSVDARGESRVKGMEGYNGMIIPMCYDCIAKIPVGPRKTIVVSVDGYYDEF